MLLPRFCLAFILSLHPSSTLLGNDGAAEIALGGIRLKQERRIAMVKERLYISKKRVRVEYEFRNESQQAVTTEIAFPIPDYQCDLGYGWSPFDDFKVWVEGAELPYQTQVHALLGDRNITSILSGFGINIGTFGDFRDGASNGNAVPQASQSQMDKLSTENLDHLISLGAIEAPGKHIVDRYHPLWTVEKTYHWTQMFPAGSVVRIAHEYTPGTGDVNQLSFDALEEPQKAGLHNRYADCGCPDKTLKETLTKAVKNRIKHQDADQAIFGRNSFSGSWVRYILTTANTWKTPIKDFELIVERDPGEFVTFCWDGPVEKAGANSFRARIKDFVPSKELTVYFLQP